MSEESNLPPGSIRLLVAATSSMTIELLLRGQLRFMSDHAFEVHVICGSKLNPRYVAQENITRVWTLPIRRMPAPLQDAFAFLRILVILLRIRPQIVNAGTPKAALLVLLAARLLRVPVRIYTLRGLRLETTHGFRRTVLRFAERLTARCANKIFAVSRSLATLYAEHGFASASKVVVLASGSSNGVDCERFLPPNPNSNQRALGRARLNIPKAAFVIGFVGRLTKDKGVPDLLEVFGKVRARFPNVRLILVGSHEAGDSLDHFESRIITSDEDIIALGHVDDCVSVYELMDILVLPSKREGFPNVVLEAAACQIPTVAYSVTGSVDAIADGVTGKLVLKNDKSGLAEAIIDYIENDNLRREHGANARKRALERFQPEVLWQAMLKEYRSMAKLQ